MESLSYSKYLLKQLDNIENDKQYESELLLNLYLTLLSLNNSNYKESMFKNKIDIIEDFLRKTNNLKVKIQLKRKEKEINTLLDDIISTYNTNIKIIDKYNKEHIDIISILNTKDAKEITKLLDKLTKEKLKEVDNKETYDKLRRTISSTILKSNYYIKENTLYIEDITISLDEFYQIFDYLLDINNYQEVFLNDNTNKLHTSLITSIINLITNKDTIDSKTIIPIILTYILSKDIPNYLEIDTSCFNIDNIKITDLYELAQHNQNLNNPKTAKWKKVLIPNEYMYQKIKQIATKGMYYIDGDKFILENIEKNSNDFKISITINNMKEFLKLNLSNL